jgi:Zn-dependent peptidase ImmA (M78 family)
VCNRDVTVGSAGACVKVVTRDSGWGLLLDTVPICHGAARGERVYFTHMVTRATALNPAVLRWAREQSGLSVEDAASRIRKSWKDLAAWEAGERFPTYNQLEALAERVYHRPVALFFLPSPPDEIPPVSEFRTLPDPDKAALEPDTLLALREARAFQESVRQLSEGRNPAERLIWRDLQGFPDRVVALAGRVRDYLGVSLEEQMSWRSSREAMAEWRDRVEAAGVFVFKRSFEQRDVSGFCMHDPGFPVIFINNSTAFTRQIFTLMHELAHILFDVSGITRVDSSFVEDLSGEAGRIEVACNRFAAEVLLPESVFPWSRFSQAPYDEAVAEVAVRFKVSREVILRRLLDAGHVSRSEYREKTWEWFLEYQTAERGAGGNYYNTQAAYLGKAFLDLAFSQFHAGRVSLPELADHLGIKARNVGRLEETVLARR